MKRDAYGRSAWLFLRLLALIHLVAFVSYWTQSAGLVGDHGILPATHLFAVIHRQLGASAYWRLPSLCWWLGAGRGLPVFCGAGVILSILLFCGIAPAPCLALLWADYLSIAGAGQIFFDFQWDALLLETTLLAVFFAPWSLRPGWRRIDPPPLGRWLLVWLLFRLMFLSGLVKLAGGDPTWRHLTALTFHYETQPLPTPLAWYAYQLPAWFHRASCAVMFLIELASPWFLLASRKWRHPAALAQIGLQAVIATTGNYTFFNLLTVALCFLCLDDQWWESVWASVRGRARPLGAPEQPGGPSGPALPSRETRHAPVPVLACFAIFVVFCTATEALADFFPAVAYSPSLGSIFQSVAPFRSLNNYGLFAQMTITRPELVIQGSDDGREWRSYELPHKPGDLSRSPDFVAPFQPRLDWQLWFAALESADYNRWVTALCLHLLHGTPEVLALFRVDPFPNHPPQFIRVVRFDYRFTSRAERKLTGNWWKRDVLDFYVPAFSL